MKKITPLVLFLVINLMYAQDKMTSSKGTIYFEASIPLFEEVKAKNEAVDCVLLPEKSQVTFVATIRKFHFKRNLMKEHFNNNYMESDRYPQASFKGIIEKFDLKDIMEEETQYQIKGIMEIHGESKLIIVTAKIKRVANGIQINSNFILNTDDFKIKIPNIVIAKVSKNVYTEFACILK